MLLEIHLIYLVEYILIPQNNIHNLGTLICIIVHTNFTNNATLRVFNKPLKVLLDECACVYGCAYIDISYQITLICSHLLFVSLRPSEAYMLHIMTCRESIIASYNGLSRKLENIVKWTLANKRQ